MSYNINEIEHIQDFFPKYIQKEISLICQDQNFRFAPNISTPNIKFFIDWYIKISQYKKIEDTHAFTSLVEEDSKHYKKLASYLQSAIKKKFNLPIKKIDRIMFVMIPPNPIYKENHELPPHVDVNDQEGNIKNLLYYINDNDAPTVFYNQKVNNIYDTDLNNLNIVHKVFPKKGSATLWDGSIVHGGSVSKTYLRKTLNVLFY